jgi:thiamine-phosphate pyrophosphorylase
MKLLPSKGLYAITDCTTLNTEQLIHKTGLILHAGTAMLQYRNKHDDYSSRKSQVIAVKALCDQFNVPLIINDDLDLAMDINADGVHLGKDDLDIGQARTRAGHEMIIGVSCYNDPARAMAAEYLGASYVALGAFFPTLTKPDTVKAGPDLICAVKQKIKLPVVAIGGITPENGRLLTEAGADFLAVVSGVYGADDPVLAVRSYLELFNTG